MMPHAPTDSSPRNSAVSGVSFGSTSPKARQPPPPWSPPPPEHPPTAPTRRKKPTKPPSHLHPGLPPPRYTHLRLPRGGRDFFFNDTTTTEISTLSLHDALPTRLNDQ